MDDECVYCNWFHQGIPNCCYCEANGFSTQLKLRVSIAMGVCKECREVRFSMCKI